MPLHNASTREDLPQYENPHKQEAVEFLARDIDEQPLIDGMEDVDRVDAWLDVLERFDTKWDIQGALREQRAQLLDELDQQAEITPASQTDAGQQAIADGGAEVVEEDTAGDEWKSRDDQDVLQYADEQEFEGELRSARSLAKEYDDVGAIEDALEREEQREEWRPHVAQALQERLEVLK